MCGIFGWLSRRTKEVMRPDLTSVLRHRGPDDEGFFYTDDSVVFGHTRLSILDLSYAGHQPMHNQDGSICITYNGEIYNFRELRKDLEGRGIQFRSRTDTEVILHGYEQWGEDVLNYLNGMFAFGICDKRRKRIFLARDRLGIKPLYYTVYNGTFAFASEIKALLALENLPRQVNWQAVSDYFSFLYIPGPGTAFEEIFQLLPGHFLMYDFESRKLKIQKYWSPVGQNKKGREGSLNDLHEELGFLLEDSVKQQLVSDVPLGVFLSGGIDSTILTALASQALPERLKTFTVLFEGEGIAPYDETEYARRVSRRYETDHHEIPVSLSQPDELLDLISCFDQPFANPTFYLSYLISKKTREHVTVALSGAGGDELFGGYPRYRVVPYSRMLGLLPQCAEEVAAKLLGYFPENYENQRLRRLKLLARGIGQDFPEQYLRWTYYFSDKEKEKLLSPLFSRVGPLAPSVRIVGHYLHAANGLPDLPTRVQYLDLFTFLQDNILEYTDKTSMAASLEVRVPFLDHRLVELSFRVPWGYKIRNGTSKYILKETFRDLIPKQNFDAPKRGFCPPLALWMERSLDRYFDVRMTRESVRQQGIFDWDTIQQLRWRHKRRQRDNSMELLGIIMFDVWWRTFIDQKSLSV